MKKYLEKEKAIDTLARLYERIKREEHDQEAANGVWRAIEAIAALGDAWIPASERLPKKPKENPLYDNKPLELYLVSVKNTDCVIRAFWNGATFTDGWEKLDVLAWMPLPEPYKEAEGMKYDKERFEWLPYEKKMGLIERELSLETHNATTRADLLMLLDREYKKIKADEKRIEDAIAHCYMTKFEYPGMEEGLCAGLRTMGGDGEPYGTCKECRLQYQYDEMHQEEEK